MSKLGIMGGTFNPIHTAHLVIAQAALKEYELSSVIFLPNYSPPHKANPDSVDAEQRLRMVKAAVAGNEHFVVSDYEIKNGGLSYTADTLEYFAAKNPMDELYFIIGGDSLRDFPTWYRPDKISKLCTLLAYPRNDFDFKANAKILQELFGANVFEIHAPRLDISSSLIRQRQYEGKSIRYLVPDGVKNIIASCGLYEKRVD